MLRFEWDQNKDKVNRLKHGISFEEAASVFQDEYAILFDDPEHSEEEERYLIIGVSAFERICIVSHCFRGKDMDTIRIISARKANKVEKAFYDKYSGGGY